MTKQTVELVYHDAKEVPEKSERFYNASDHVMGWIDDHGWEIVYWGFENKSWRRAKDISRVEILAWTPLPPKPKKKVWVKKEAKCLEMSLIGDRNSILIHLPPGPIRNPIFTYEIEEEQP